MRIADRLALVRKAQGRSLDEVAQAAGIPASQLDTYEKNRFKQPDEETLAALADTLGTSVEFFQREDDLFTLHPLSEPTKKLDKESQSLVLAQASLWLERSFDIESLLGEEGGLRVPTYPDGFPARVASGAEAANAAERVREAWGLGNLMPLGYMADLLEMMGVRVMFIPGVAQLDAVAFAAEGPIRLPVIAVRADLAGEFQRFAMARETAYFVLDRCDEKIASHFAAALLMPAPAMQYEMGDQRSGLEPLEMFFIKEKYGVSYRHLVGRAASLKIIDPGTHEAFMQLYKEQNWGIGEPGGPLPPEENRQLLKRVMRLQLENPDVGFDGAAGLVGLTPADWADRLTLGQLRAATS